MRKELLTMLAVYSIGLAITAWYVFGTRYLGLPDAVREYQLFIWMRESGYWHVYNYAHISDNQYVLQASCLFTTYFPAKLSLIFPVAPELFYKVYIAVILPILPVAVYLLARKFTGSMNSFIAALFIIAWVSFIDGASTARTGVAIVFYAVALLLIFSDRISSRVRYPALILSCICIPLAHYSTATLAVGIMGAMAASMCIFRRFQWKYRAPVIAAFMSIILAEAIWCYGIEQIKIVSIDPGVTLMGGGSIWSLDLPGRAALGLGNPDGSPANALTYSLMALGWGTIMFIAYGLLKALKDREYPLEIRVLGAISFGVCALFFLVQPLARVYGVERVYFQSMVVLGLFFIYGVVKFAGKFRIPGYVLGIPIVIIYGVMMKAYELTHSIVEYR